MAKLKRAANSALYGGGYQLSDDPVNIINEYLALVREKLPDSIADDVITELETYMLETASDLGNNGQITLESAKKVVAQFGAPGEVADEYRFSMLPETIPEKDIPVEIKQDTREIEQKKVEPEEAPPKVPGVDPTTSYTTFFFKSLILTLIWASIVTIIPALILPFWPLGVQVIFIIISVAIVTVFLLVQTSYLKGRKTILWKRTYPDWSIFQTLVTLPENAIPEAGINQHRLDIVASMIGLLLFVPLSFQWYHPISVFVAIPAVILLIARIFLTVRKLDEDKDPYEKAKQEFAINLSLLLLLESSIYSLVNPYGWWNPFILWIGPFVATYVMLFGAVLLFCLIVGTQNLWWKTEEQLASSEEVTDQKLIKKTQTKDYISKGLSLAISIIGRSFLFISVPFLVHFFFMFNIMSFNNGVLTGLTIIAVALSVIFVSVYCLGRGLMIKFKHSSTIIGTRTRVESLIDLGIGGILFGGLIALVVTTRSIQFYPLFIPNFHVILTTSYTLGGIIFGFEITAIVLAFIGFPVRIIGNILEFWSERKFIATLRIQDSSTILFTSVTLLATNEYIAYVVTGNVHFINYFFIMYLILAIYLAYQMVASGMKIEEIAEQKEKVIAEKSEKVHSMNKNATMAN